MPILQKELFNYDRKEDFPEKLAQWIGDVFYDILPEHGYEVRDEQIYTAYQLAEAVCKKKVHLAEAGLGIGKTYAYLLTAIAYARLTRKPVVIACATTALQDQLSGPDGDIQTLAQLLGTTIDARMAKDPRQYICDARVHEFEPSDIIDNEIYTWLEQTKSGERSEIPHISDHIWKQIGWDESMSCDKCMSRGFCKLVKAREHYRLASDLIIADHSIFFEDLWSRDERILDGKLPILPSYCAVIFDEGHKVMLPALMRAGQQILEEEINDIISTLQKIQGARKSLISIVVELERASTDFFKKLSQQVIDDDDSERLAIKVDDELLSSAESFRMALNYLLLELQIEQELYLESLPTSLFLTFEAHIERATLALNRFGKNKSEDMITWVDKREGSFWVVPRHIDKMLHKHLYQKGLPVVFTSATLSNEGDFSYFNRIFGLKNPSSSTVESIFDFEEQVSIYIQPHLENSNEVDVVTHKITQLVSLLKKNGGRALILTNSVHDVERIREALGNYPLHFEILWEDRGERGYLLRRFREDISSVLVGTNFWEGIDVPGEALSLLIIWQLPFPSQDPLIEDRRKEVLNEGLNPLITVDYPEMGLKLKQGCGRLIRTREDLGTIAILEPFLNKPWESVVLGALPHGAKIHHLSDK